MSYPFLTVSPGTIQIKVTANSLNRKHRELVNSIALLPILDFQSFIDPTDTIAQILLGHFVALHTLMMPIKAYEMTAGRTKTFPNKGRKTLFLMKPIWDRIPFEMKQYMQWPMRVTYVSSIPSSQSHLERTLGSKCEEMMSEKVF